MTTTWEGRWWDGDGGYFYARDVPKLEAQLHSDKRVMTEGCGMLR